MNDQLKNWERPWFLGEGGIDAYLAKDDYVVLDFETTNLTNGLALDQNNRLVLACWTVVKDGVATEKAVFGDEYDMQELVADIQRAKFLVAHNAKFELQWLMRCGLDPRDVLLYDTMVAEWVIGGNKKVPFNLDDTAKRYKVGGKASIVSKLIKLGVCPSVIPQSWLLNYCKIDVDICHKIFLKQHELVSNQDVWHIVLQRNLVIPVLADIELQGLQLDKEAVYEEYEKQSKRLEELGLELDAITGGINLGSPKQLGTLLYDTLGFAEPIGKDGNVIKTSTGNRSTAIDSIALLQPASELQLKFLELYKEYNNCDTLLSKNLNFFKLVCDERDGVFYGQINHCRTANHRLASSGIKMKFAAIKKELAVQLQNLPRQYKRLFTAHDPNEVVTEYDGSQIEFRVAAEVGHDDVAENDIVTGVDIHSFTRDTMNAAFKRLGILKEIDRQDAKPQTFAPLYGAQGQDAAEQEYTKAFRAKYHALAQTQTDWTLVVADRKKLTTPYGLTFHWPDAKMYRSGYVKFSTEIFNLPISGFATGEIIPIALVFFWHRIRGTRTKIFNTVHDSICVRQPAEDVERITEIAKQAMTHDVYAFLRDVYRYNFRVPLGFGAKTGRNWGVSKVEHKWDVWPQGWERLQVEENKVTRVVYDTRPNMENQQV